jgi:acid phosphatase family membrane protein YuiD
VLNILQPIFDNKALVIPFVAWTLAQIIKVLLSSLKQKRLDLALLLSSGGMPSSHAALVCALATVVGITDGVNSTNFALAVFFAAIVMYDAAGVRWAVSRQARILNRIVDEFYKGDPHIEQHLIELIGHTRVEVLAGAAFGIVLALIMT